MEYGAPSLAMNIQSPEPPIRPLLQFTTTLHVRTTDGRKFPPAVSTCSYDSSVTNRVLLNLILTV
jgi:hypothetical protein